MKIKTENKSFSFFLKLKRKRIMIDHIFFFKMKIRILGWIVFGEALEREKTPDYEK